MSVLNHVFINPKLEMQRLIGILREKARHALSSAELPEKIYHYTDLNGLKGIVESETIYFSAMHMLNDASEVSYMWDLLQKNRECISMEENTAYKNFVDGFYEYGASDELCKDFFTHKKMPKFLNIFSSSFSVNGDSLHLWNGYSGKEHKGYNLTFSEKMLRLSFIEKSGTLAYNNSNFLAVLKQEGKSIENYSPLFFYGLTIYEIEHQVKALKKLFLDFWEFYRDKRNKGKYEAGQSIGMLKDLDYDSFVYLHLFQAMTILMVFIKNPYFLNEEEYRIAFFDYANVPGEPTVPKFLKVNSRKSGKYDIPYIAIPYDRKLIQKVTISPPSGDADRKNLVEDILLSNYVHVTVDFSEIPLR